MGFRNRRGRGVPWWLLVTTTALGATLVAYRVQARREANQVWLDDEVLNTPTSGPPAEPTSTTIALNGRSYEIGDCVTWNPKIDAGSVEPRSTSVVNCDEPHLIEIAGSRNVTGPVDHFPTDAEWEAIFEKECRPIAEERVLKGPLDPYGRFIAGGITPGHDGWLAGDRTVWCGVSARETSPPPADVDGAYIPVVGRVAGQSQTLVDPPGTCRASAATWPVPCDQPHDWEVTGTADVSGRVTQPPGPDDTHGWQRIVGADCRRAATAYLGHAASGDVSAGWSPIEGASWAAGRRLVECTVARNRNGSAVTVTGSLKR